jgi:methylated-DNA-protein-cysteine methyltransferase-like protein
VPRVSYDRIWKVVSRIPRGRVSTYGRIAALAGRPGHARLVGYALHGLPPGNDIPWHRVINARGEISFPPGSRSWREQRRLLVEEGIAFLRNRVDLRVKGWPQRGR